MYIKSVEPYDMGWKFKLWCIMGNKKDVTIETL